MRLPREPYDLLAKRHPGELISSSIICLFINFFEEPPLMKRLDLADKFIKEIDQSIINLRGRASAYFYGHFSNYSNSMRSNAATQD